MGWIVYFMLRGIGTAIVAGFYGLVLVLKLTFTIAVLLGIAFAFLARTTVGVSRRGLAARRRRKARIAYHRHQEILGISKPLHR